MRHVERKTVALVGVLRADKRRIVHALGVEIITEIRRLLTPHPAIAAVEFTGSRARGEEHALSDWDFGIQARDYPAAATALPVLLAPLDALAMQWDPLAEHPTFMLMLAGGVKVDLIFFHERFEALPPWRPARGTLHAIDDHFWDWIVWLAGKQLKGRHALVEDELAKMHGYLLGPLGVERPPGSIADAIRIYLVAREAREREFGLTVSRRLGEDVLERVRTAGLAGRS